MQKQERRKPKSQPDTYPDFVSEYVHYRTGKLMRARDYGYVSWPFGRRKKK